MKNASEEIYSILRRRIMAGFYEPSTQLKEESLAAELSVSRTPVRNAFQRLIKDGLLVARANRGVFITSWTDWDVEEVFGLRRLLEPHAAALAATRASREQVDRLVGLNDLMERASQSEDDDRIQSIQTINNQFHRQLLEAASSPRLLRICENLVDMPMIIGSFLFYSNDDIALSVTHHRQITRALQAHNPELARLAMLLHLTSTHLLYQTNRQQRPPALESDLP